MISLQELRPAVKNVLLDQGLGPALQKLLDSLPADSKGRNEAILLDADLKEADRKMVRGSISQAELDVKYNSLRERFVTLVDGLTDEDLKPVAAIARKWKPIHIMTLLFIALIAVLGVVFILPQFRPQPVEPVDGGSNSSLASVPGGDENRSGKLLYQIPSEMEVGKEKQCRVRIAYDEVVLLENIELTSDTEIRDVRIAKVMEVELIDPAESPAFSIRTFNPEEQFVEKEAYTEWIFFVKALREGKFPLMLRVAVIEKVGGEERRRDIVLEEKVLIVSEPVPDLPVDSFKTTGYAVGVAPAPSPELEEMEMPQEILVPEETPVPKDPKSYQSSGSGDKSRDKLTQGKVAKEPIVTSPAPLIYTDPEVRSRPVGDSANICTMQMARVILTKERTVLIMSLQGCEEVDLFGPDRPEHAYFIRDPQGREYALTGVKGVATGENVPVPASAEIQLLFEPLPLTTRQFDLVEGKEPFVKDRPARNFLGVSL